VSAGGRLAAGLASNQRRVFWKEDGAGLNLTIQSALSQSCYSRVRRTCLERGRQGVHPRVMLHGSKERAIHLSLNCKK
jgi:hypothetical protein